MHGASLSPPPAHGTFWPLVDCRGRHVDLRVTAEEIALVLAWAEEQGDGELLAAVRLLGGLEQKLLLGDPAGGNALLELAARTPQAPLPALLFLALDARGPLLDALSQALQHDPGAALALGSVLLLDRSEPAAAAAALRTTALLPQPGPELSGRLYEYSLLAAESYAELVALLTRRPPPGFAPPLVRQAEAQWRAGFPEARREFRRLVEESFDSYARTRLEEVLEADGEYRELAELYRMALERTPSPHDRSLILMRLGEIHEEHLGEPEAAARYYAQAEGGRINAAITSRRRALHRKSQAWEAYADSLREEARHVEDRRRAAALNLIAGRTLLESVGDPLEAARAFRAALQLHPEEPRCREFLAEALLLAGDIEGLAGLHEGPMAALLLRDARGLGGCPPPAQAAAAQRAGDWETLAAAFRRWSEGEERAPLRAAMLTFAALLDPDRGRARLDASAALFVSQSFLPALLTLARLSVLEGRLRPAMESLARAADLAGSGQIRMILLLEAADIGSGLGDPAAVAALHRAAAATLFGGGTLPLDARSLAEVLGPGGAWAQHAGPILREAKRAGFHGTLAPVLLELARPGEGKLAADALRMAIEILPARSELREPLLEFLEDRGRWAEAVALLERAARHSYDPAQKVELLGRVAMIARGPLGDQSRADRALERAEAAARTPTPMPMPMPAAAPEAPGAGTDELPAQAPEQLIAQARQVRDWDQAIPMLLAAAERFFGQGDLVRAEEAYLEVLSREASEPHALAALAALARKAGDWTSAWQWLGRLAEVESDRDSKLDVLLLRARIAREELGDPVAAARDHEACLIIDPQCPEALAALEAHYREQGDWEPLRLLYLQGLEQGAGKSAAGGEGLERTVELLVSLAELEADRLQHPERAVAHLERALSLRPGDNGLLRQLAEVAGRARHWRKQVEALEALARQVKDAGERSNLYLEIAAIYRDHLGGGGVVLENTMVAFVCDNANRRAFDELEQLYVAEHRWREVVGIYDVALGAIDQGGAYQREDLLKRKGLVLARAIDAPVEAAETLLEALSLAPDDAEVLDALELVLAQANDPEYRLRLLELQAEARTGVSRLELFLRAAELSARLPGREEAGEQYLRRALQAVPGIDERPVRALEALYAQSERWDDLLGLYEEAHRRCSEPAQRRGWLLRRAELLESRLHDLPRAAAVYQQILEEQEGDLEALGALARLYEANRSWDELLAVSRRQLLHTQAPAERAQLLFRIGSILETHRHDEPGAEEAYRTALAEDPRCFPALHGLRDLYLRRQSWGRALETLEQEAELWEEPRDRAAVLVRLGELLQQRLGDRSRAVAAYQRALRLAPGFPAAVRALLPLLIEVEAWEEARPLARQATRLAAAAAATDSATRLKALSQRALVALRLGELREAAGALQLALQLDPQYYPALEVLRELALQPRVQQLRAGALEELLSALERSPAASASAALWLPVLRGRVAEARCDIEEALRFYRVAVRALPASLEVCRPLVSLLGRHRRWSDAAALLATLAEQIGERLDRAATLLQLGRIRMDRLGEPAAAASLFAQVIQELGRLRQDDNGEGYGAGEERAWRQALFLGAQAAYLCQRWEDGLLLLRLLIDAETVDPRNVHGASSLGLYLYYLGRFQRDGLGLADEAAASFYHAVQEGPGLVDPALALARQLWHEGDQEELEELLNSQMALARERGGSEASLRLRRFLALTRFRAGHAEAALASLEQAVHEGEDPVLARRCLAQLALEAGRPEQAAEALREVLLHGGPARLTLQELARIEEQRGDGPRLTCLQRLLAAWEADGGTASGPTEPVPRPEGALRAEVLRQHAVHADACGLLLELWPLLVPRLELDQPDTPAFEPLPGPHELLQGCAARLAARFGVAQPALGLLPALAQPAALCGSTLLVAPGLLASTDQEEITFWLAGVFFLQQQGLALAAHPLPGVAERTARACAAVIAEAAGLAVPARWSVAPAPSAGLEVVQQALAALAGQGAASPGGGLCDPGRFLTGLELSAHRVGLLAVGEPAAALKALRRALPTASEHGSPRSEPRPVRELIHFAVGDDHFAAREKLGLAVC